MTLLISLLRKSKRRLYISVSIGILNALLSITVLAAINNIVAGQPPENVTGFTLFFSGLLVLILVTVSVSRDLINRLGLQMSHDLALTMKIKDVISFDGNPGYWSPKMTDTLIWRIDYTNLKEGAYIVFHRTRCKSKM